MRLLDERIAPRVQSVLDRYQLTLIPVAPGLPIPFSYFGAPEAGLLGRCVFARSDTPVHSVLHEAGHVICMDEARRVALRADAGGAFDEENAVLYLQITLASEVGLAPECLCKDMDEWGYTFRMGSAWAWYQTDAAECRQQLLEWGVLDAQGAVTFKMRSGGHVGSASSAGTV